MQRTKDLKRVIGRVGFVFAVLLVLTATANAYTVVMSGGRRVEVPSTFVLTASTLTYEVSPGVQITLSLAAIDVAATEKANGEVAGSFLRRIQTSGGATAKTQDAVATNKSRTITNRDLEAVQKRRRESEQAYEVRRQQLQLPTVEETRKRAAEESAAIAVELGQTRAAQDDAERYWRERATTLRTEIAAVDAEIAFVRSKLDEGWSTSFGGWSGVSVTNTFGVVGGFPSIGFGRWPLGGFRGRGHFGGSHRPNIYVAPRGGIVRGHVGFGGGGTRGRVFLNSGFSRQSRHFGAGGFPAFPSAGVIGVGVPALDYSYERSELITRFNELGATRAGLRARWRELEEEARRAGAPPGWLRE